MKKNGKIGTLLMTLGFLLSVLAVVAPAGAAAGRAEHFAVTVEFTNPDGSHDNSSVWMATEPVNITATVSLVAMMENVTDLMLELTINGDMEGDPVSIGALNEGESVDYTWQWHPMAYGEFVVMVAAVNATEVENQTVVTEEYTFLASDIVVESVSLSASEALIGVDTVTITASLVNNGNMDGTATVMFVADADVRLGEKDITLASGEGGDIALDTDFGGFDLADGEHSIRAMVQDWGYTEARADPNITLATPMADVAVDTLTVDPASAYEGATVTLKATLNNTGTADSPELVVDFYEGSNKLGNVTNVTVPMGETKDVTFQWTLPDVAADTVKNLKAMVGTSEAMANVTVKAKLPQIQITSFTVPDGLKVGDMVDFTAVIKNNGTGDATGVVVEFYDGTTKLANSTAFDLPAGNTTTVTLKVTMIAPADVDHKFFAKAMGAEMNVTKKVAHVPIPAKVAITTFSVKPTKKDGQPKDSTQSYTLTVVLSNTGELATTNCTLTIKEGTKNIATEAITLGGNSTVTKTYTWKVKGSGGHTATATLTGSEADPAGSTKTAKCILEYTPGFEVLFLVAAIFVAALLIRRRKD
ncbi:MAG: hypothetical protein FJ149_00900 [Euryarchaeota archaeon]|nr:hypothetical protein [Euryarchaeota archaeon]